jgi:hypothetical protein
VTQGFQGLRGSAPRLALEARRERRRRRRLEARVARWRRDVPDTVLWPEPVSGGPLEEFARRDQIWDCGPVIASGA